jgi:hypothetical protein
METLKYFTMQKYNLRNNPLKKKKAKILQDIIITLLKIGLNLMELILY